MNSALQTNQAGEPAGGSVTLVGAGPGDPELLTLRAVRALQAADIILFDHLVSDAVLDLARDTARKMLVGKRGYRPSCRQQDINDMMIRLARRGRHVVRLKSGDPMIFGRAGEEIAQLNRAGVAFDVVPGITAASAMAASLGVSLTHREHAQSVQYVTAHGKDGGLPPGVDWPAISSPQMTLVFYMGARMAPRIASQLTDNGLSPSHPAVACTSVSRPDARVWGGPLSGLHNGVDLLGCDAPLIIGVGAVFTELAASLSGSVRGGGLWREHHDTQHILRQAAAM